jgi:hypothetical protein
MEEETGMIGKSSEWNGHTPSGEVPLGKCQGMKLTDAPLQQLVLLLEDFKLERSVASAIRQEVCRRVKALGWGDPGNASSTPWVAVIQEWFRELALKYHPDRGGDDKIMAVLNEAHEQLQLLAGVAFGKGGKG